MPKGLKYIVLFCAAAGCAAMSCSDGSPPEKRLLLCIPLFAEDAQVEPAYAAQLDQYMQDGDIFFFRAKPLVLPLLKEIKNGKTAIIRQSVEDIEKDIAFMDSNGVKFDYICYNPEKFPNSHTPDEEKADAVKAAVKLREIADRRGIKLLIVPDSKNILVKNGPELARYADVFAIQLQAWQSLPEEEFRAKAEELISIVRKGNPGVPVIAQLSTNPPALSREKGQGKGSAPMAEDDIIKRINCIKDLVDGVGFLLMKDGDGFERLKKTIKIIKN